MSSTLTNQPGIDLDSLFSQARKLAPKSSKHHQSFINELFDCEQFMEDNAYDIELLKADTSAIREAYLSQTKSRKQAVYVFNKITSVLHDNKSKHSSPKNGSLICHQILNKFDHFPKNGYLICHQILLRRAANNINKANGQRFVSGLPLKAVDNGVLGLTHHLHSTECNKTYLSYGHYKSRIFKHNFVDRLQSLFDESGNHRIGNSKKIDFDHGYADFTDFGYAQIGEYWNPMNCKAMGNVFIPNAYIDEVYQSPEKLYYKMDYTIGMQIVDIKDPNRQNIVLINTELHRNGLSNKFSFDHFSAAFKQPLSTTYDNGIVLELHNTQWDRVPTSGKINWKIKKTLSITPTVFERSLKSAMACHNYKLMPIVNGEYLQIVTITDGIDIGILYQLSALTKKYLPVSIHLDSEYFKQYPHYYCLEHFASNITHLRIGDQFVCDGEGSMCVHVTSLDGETHTFSRQDIIECSLANFVNEWNDDPTRTKCDSLTEIMQCFRDYNVMTEYIEKGRRKDLMFLLKSRCNVKKVVSSALWLYFSQNSIQ